MFNFWEISHTTRRKSDEFLLSPSPPVSLNVVLLQKNKIFVFRKTGTISPE